MKQRILQLLKGQSGTPWELHKIASYQKAEKQHIDIELRRAGDEIPRFIYSWYIRGDATGKYRCENEIMHHVMHHTSE